ncbi:hypothetical protein F4806DRAFT_504124 [Annulohypoxylon nitens]|nr:hypothetical protein F4806DRAFT_504124 [Annulohypoxylon nitens]
MDGDRRERQESRHRNSSRSHSRSHSHSHSRRPSRLANWYASLPPPRSDTPRGRIIVTLVAMEVSSPQTIVVAGRRGSPPHAKCSGQSLNVLKGQEFNLNIDIVPYKDSSGRHLPGAIDALGPASIFYVQYEDTANLSTFARTSSNTEAHITVRGGKCDGLQANSWDILNLQHIQLSNVAIHTVGHYYLHLVIEKEDANGGKSELLAKIRTRKIKVAEQPQPEKTPEKTPEKRHQRHHERKSPKGSRK